LTVITTALVLALGAGVGTAQATGLPAPPAVAPPTQSIDQSQANASENEQIQVVPIAPQVNVQNVNVLTGGDVEQGNANNANTGQATQQENTQVAAQNGSVASTGQSQTSQQGQGNASENEQIQIVPIAPQVNLQNVNVLTFGDVEQGNANNANPGQATQQQNTQVAGQSSDGAETKKHGYGAKSGECRCSSQLTGGQSIRQWQGNWSENEQIQFIPIAPQLNAQNVNILTFGDVEQGNANNANTGQATQQQNTQLASQGPLRTGRL
jgi:hypothetical protein